jgi:ADP-ribosylglycohydrolase
MTEQCERLTDQVLGCLLGGLCGDAVGRPAENLDYRTIEERYGRITGPMEQPGTAAGAGTDDSALKHLLCDAIIHAPGEVTPYDWAQVWRERMQPDRFWTPVANAYFRIMVQDVDPAEAGVGNMISNSSAMCISPVGIVNAGNPQAACREALSVARIIHRGSPLEGAAAAAAATAEAFRNGATPSSIVEAACDHLPPGSDVATAIQATVAAAQECGDYETFRARYYEEMLWPWPHRHTGRSTAVDPRESLSVALAILYLAGGDPVQAILNCANFGRDADTIATMGGAIAGALRGARSLPSAWVDAVREANPVDQDALAQSLLEVLAKRVRAASDWAGSWKGALSEVHDCPDADI